MLSGKVHAELLLQDLRKASASAGASNATWAVEWIHDLNQLCISLNPQYTAEITPLEWVTINRHCKIDHLTLTVAGNYGKISIYAKPLEFKRIRLEFDMFKTAEEYAQYFKSQMGNAFALFDECTVSFEPDDQVNEIAGYILVRLKGTFDFIDMRTLSFIDCDEITVEFDEWGKTIVVLQFNDRRRY